MNLYTDLRQLIPSHTQGKGSKGQLASENKDNTMRISCITPNMSGIKKKVPKNSRWYMKPFKTLYLYWICQPRILQSTIQLQVHWNSFVLANSNITYTAKLFCCCFANLRSVMVFVLSPGFGYWLTLKLRLSGSASSRAANSPCCIFSFINQNH